MAYPEANVTQVSELPGKEFLKIRFAPGGGGAHL